MECVPTASAVVAVAVATPEPFSVPVLNVAVPSLKVTVPVGIPMLGEFAVTVAEKVTEFPDSDGFSEEVTTLVVGAVLTVTVEVLVVAEP
jgi:hypothetical protein